MFPIVLDLANLKVALVGGGDGALKRLKALDESGARYVKVYADNFGKEFWNIVGDRLITRMPHEEEMKAYNAIMIVDIPDEKAARLADAARRQGVLVNVEDRKEHCDFFYPSIVRRGDLLITVSTCGKSPTLAKRIRDVIGKIFYDAWAKRVEELAVKRQQWRDIGLNNEEVANMSNKFIDEEGWLDYEELAEVKREEEVK